MAFIWLVLAFGGVGVVLIWGEGVALVLWGFVGVVALVLIAHNCEGLLYGLIFALCVALLGFGCVLAWLVSFVRLCDGFCALWRVLVSWLVVLVWCGFSFAFLLRCVAAL